MAKNLTELAERTATANTDLMHINSGGTDYKEQKINFLQGELWHDFATDSTLISQVDALANAKTYFGRIAANGHQTETALPVNAHCYVKAAKYTSSYCVVEIWSINNPQGQHWITGKNNGTWSDWQHVPARSEMDTALSYVNRIGYIDANSSLTMTIASSSRIAIYCIGFSTNSSNEFLVLSNSSGTVNCYPVGSSSALSTSTTTNSLTITNTAGSGVYVSAVVFAGSVSTS